MPDETTTTKPIDYNNLDAAKQPSTANSGFSAMDTVKPEADQTTKTTGDAVAAPTTEENKLPPANELMQSEEDPTQRKIAGEAPYVTAGNPSAFTPEVEGGVVTPDGKSKQGTGTTPVDNSVPVL